MLFLIMILSFPTVSSANFFDDLGEKIGKEAKRTEKRIKEEKESFDPNNTKHTENLLFFYMLL